VYQEYLGNVDSPIPKAPTSDIVTISGWALDTSGKVFYSIALKCGAEKFEAKLNLPRPDVEKAHPDQVESGISGYELAVNLSQLSGNVQAELLATTQQNEIVILSTFEFNVTLKPPHFSLETPCEGSLQTGQIRFSGWCFHPAHHILELSIIIDGGTYVCEHGFERDDVSVSFPLFENSTNSGFEALINLPAGNHELYVEALLDNGKVIKIPFESVIKVRNPPLWQIAYRKTVSSIGFMRFALSKARAWRRSGGRLQSIRMIPQLVRKTLQVYRASNTATGFGDVPPGFELPEKEDLYTSWLRCNQWNNRRKKELINRLSKHKGTPLISVVMPVFNPPISYLELAVESVKQQVYENWELCIADDCSTNPDVLAYLKKVAATDSRIKLAFREENGNISLATNSAAEIASGEFIAFLDQDDELTPDALAEVALYLADHPQCDYLYTDDDKIGESGERFAPQFKPDWSPELLLSYMYFSHVIVVRRSIFADLGGFRVGFEGSQDYDFALRATEKARHVGHIPLVLYHWRVLQGSTAQSGNAKPESFNAGLTAVQESLDRRGIKGKACHPKWAKDGGLGIFSVDFPDEGPSVTLVIPTKNALDILKTCIHSLELTTYRNFDVVIVDNESDDPETLKFLNECGHTVLRVENPPGGFNYSYVNNRAVEVTDSDYVLFLNNDTKVLSPTWLSQMMGYASIEGVGAVGARLLYPDNQVQHAGIVHGYYKGMTGPAHKLLPSWNNGYLSYAAVPRNYLAVTAACLLMPRQLFNALNGFNETDFGVAYNDVDLCYRIVDGGLRCVYSPGSELVHYEGKTRGYDDKPAEEAAFKLKNLNRVDQYYNPNLSLESERFELQARASDLRRPEQPIRALMVAFNLNLEGAPYSQYELTVGLKLLGVIHPVVYCPEDGPLRELYEKAGIEVIVRTHPLRGVFGIGNYDTAINQFSELIQEFEIQIVYGNTLQTFYAIDAANRIGLPSIWNPRESEPWQTYFAHFGSDIAVRALECFAYPYRVIFVADSTRQGCEQLNSANNFATIHNGLEPQRAEKERLAYPRTASRAQLAVLDDEVVVLLLGTVCERKGQLDLIRAIQALSASSSIQRLRFFIVGDRKSAYSIQLHRELDCLPEAVRARVTVVEETKEKGLYLSAADIFICSSRVESYPRVILEAMYYQLAIVTTPVFGISEQLKDKINALFYSPADIKRLAEHIERLALDNDLRDKLSVNAGLRLQRLTSFEEMLEQYADHFVGAYYSQESDLDH